MGPRGQLSLKEELKDRKLFATCERRQKALEVLKQKGYADFARHCVDNNIQLHDNCGRGHMMRIKAYLLRDETLNDGFFVKAILNKDIKSEDLMKLVELSLECKEISLFTVERINIKYIENFIEIVKDYSFRMRGCRGQIGPGDDGFGGRYCGATPCIRQYLNDPYDILMALFVRGNIKLVDFMLDVYPDLKHFLKGTLELFLIDENAYVELSRIVEYLRSLDIHQARNTCVHHEYAYNFAKRRYPDVKEKYEFLKKEGFDLEIKENERFFVKTELITVWCTEKEYY